jgi:hypothetical protein
MRSPYGPAFDQARAWEHWRHFETVAQHLGVEMLALYVPATKAEIEAALALPDGEHLNGIHLQRWDRCESAMRNLVRQKVRFWSLSDTVCTLKHVARHHIAKCPEPPHTIDDLSAEREQELSESLDRQLLNRKALP